MDKFDSQEQVYNTETWLKHLDVLILISLIVVSVYGIFKTSEYFTPMCCIYILLDHLISPDRTSRFAISIATLSLKFKMRELFVLDFRVQNIFTALASGAILKAHFSLEGPEWICILAVFLYYSRPIETTRATKN